MKEARYKAYIDILKEELRPALGCTEPIAVAYAAALAARELGRLPKRVEISVSGNIIKNVKSVIVPNTGGMRGLPAAAAAGIVAGDPDKELEVIARVTDKQKKDIADFLEATPQHICGFMIFLSAAMLLWKGIKLTYRAALEELLEEDNDDRI